MFDVQKLSFQCLIQVKKIVFHGQMFTKSIKHWYSFFVQLDTGCLPCQGNEFHRKYAREMSGKFGPFCNAREISRKGSDIPGISMKIYWNQVPPKKPTSIPDFKCFNFADLMLLHCLAW